jgi:hypothetical protein
LNIGSDSQKREVRWFPTSKDVVEQPTRLTVKAFSVNASFQSVAEVQRSTHRRLPQPDHLSVQLFMPDRSSVLSRGWLLHDEIFRSGRRRAVKILVISTNNLQDVFTSYAQLFRWLHTRKPIAKIGYSILFTISPTMQKGLMKLEETYVIVALRDASGSASLDTEILNERSQFSFSIQLTRLESDSIRLQFFQEL